MTFRRLVLLVSLLAVFCIGVRFAADTDTWWHLAAGEWMVGNRALLDTDVFSHSRAGEPWANHSWLAQLILYGTYEVAGLPGLNLLTAVLAVAAFLLLWTCLEGPALLRGFVTLLAASTAAVFWSARPQMFSFLLAAAFLWVLERWRQGQTFLLRLLPALMILWANLHGGFAVGFILLVLYLGGSWIQHFVHYLQTEIPFRRVARVAWSESRGLVFASAAAILAVTLNPRGPALLALPFQTISVGVLQQYIQEWQSPNFHLAQTLPFAVMLLLTPVAMATSRRDGHPTEYLLFAGLGYLSLTAARNISVFALAVAPTMSRHGQDALEAVSARIGGREDLPPRLANFLNLVLLSLVVVAAALWALPRLSPEFNEQTLEERMPVEAMDYMAREPLSGPLLNAYDWGGFVIWRLWPEQRTYVDGRTDLFGDEVLEEYLSLWRAEDGWKRTMEQRGFETVLLERRAPLVQLLLAEGWIPRYLDADAAVLTKP